MSWAPVTRTVLEAARGDNVSGVPSVAWFRTRKGRGYGKFDAPSHGTPWPRHAPEVWAVRREFMARHGVAYEGVDEPAPSDAAVRMAQTARNLDVALSVLRRHVDPVRWLTERLPAIAAPVPVDEPGLRLGDGGRVFDDGRLFDTSAYPQAMW